jgi:hypothetical protein
LVGSPGIQEIFVQWGVHISLTLTMTAEIEGKNCEGTSLRQRWVKIGMRVVDALVEKPLNHAVFLPDGVAAACHMHQNNHRGVWNCGRIIITHELFVIPGLKYDLLMRRQRDAGSGRRQ